VNPEIPGEGHGKKVASLKLTATAPGAFPKGSRIFEKNHLFSGARC